MGLADVRRFLVAVLIGVIAATPQAPAQSSRNAEDRIARICGGLEHTVTITGMPAPGMSLSERMKFYHVPGVSVAVIHNRKLDWARAFGVARVGGPKVTPQTLFQAASITKPITAVAALCLVRDGKINLDEDVNTYLKTWKVPENAFTLQKKVTLRELLNHTAGISVHGFPGYRNGGPVPTLLQILNGESPANTPAIRVTAVPGTRWEYSGGGYVIVQQLISDITGKPLRSLVQKAVLNPLRMSHSTFQPPPPSDAKLHLATPYDAEGNPLPGGPRIVPDGPGGLWTTPADLALFAMELQKEYEGKSDRILSQTIATEMLTAGLGHQGLGFLIEGSPSRLFFAHEGNTPGYQSKLVASLDGKDGAIVMTNGNRGWQLMGEILRSIAREYGWNEYRSITRTVVHIDPSILDRLTGTYGGYLIITRDGDKLMGEIPGGVSKVELYPESTSRYFFRDAAIEINFDLNAPGRAAGAEFITPMVHNPLKRTR